jgi:general secretion pathway protein D
MNPRTVTRRLAAIVFALACAAVTCTTASAAAKSQVTLNLKDADIGTLIQTVSEVTGKNFIVDPRVRGKVTVISSTPMDAAAVYETFLSVLQVQGFAAIPAGAAIKVIPETMARQEGGSHLSAAIGVPGDAVITHVYAIRNASAVQLVNVLRPLVAQGGQLAAYTPGNMIIISDRASNVRRIEHLIDQIDTQGDRDVQLVPLDNASADDVVKVITALQQQDKQVDPTARPAAAIPDERSNSVLVAGNREDRQKIVDLIHQLDSPEKENSYTQVVFLQYANAETLAPILQGYAQQEQKSSSSSSNSSSNFGFGSNSSSSTESKSSAPSTPTQSYSPSYGAGAGGGMFDKTTIVADKDTNALVISAPPKTMRLIRSVIRQLDIQRKQVLVDAIIAEVSANKSSELGIDWAAYNPHSIAAAGILNTSTLSAIQSAASAVTTTGTSSTNTSQLIGAASGLLGQGLNAGGFVNTNNGSIYGALLKALRSDGDTNILSTPTITTLDNEEAKISVGQEVPFLTGQFSNTGVSSSNGVVNPFQTIDRKDVGLSLGITPTITAGNTLMLKIELENSSLSSGSAGAANLITNKRTINDKVTVEDGQILVLGGLMDDQLDDAKNSVPVLGSIPLIGALFRSHSITKVKRNLMVFIHPVILRTVDDGNYFTRAKYDSVRRSELKAATGAVPLVGGERPLLYDYDDYLKRTAKPPELRAPAANTSSNISSGAATPSTGTTDATGAGSDEQQAPGATGTGAGSDSGNSAAPGNAAGAPAAPPPATSVPAPGTTPPAK